MSSKLRAIAAETIGILERGRYSVPGGGSDRVIYSPAVPVFRDDDGVLLARPYPVSFLTAAAPNLAVHDRQPGTPVYRTFSDILARSIPA